MAEDDKIQHPGVPMTIATYLRLNPSVRARLDDYATRTRRNLSKAAEVLIEQALDAQDPEQK